MFKVGERVCYPMHGVGEIEGIEERTVLGETASYYVLRFLIGRMTAFVPVKRAQSVGLRYVIDGSECEKVLAFLKETPPEETGNWNQRYRENYEKLRRGSVYEVAEVVRCLRKREAEKGLSSGEKKMLAGAQHVLVSELSAASGIGAEELFRIIGGA